MWNYYLSCPYDNIKTFSVHIITYNQGIIETIKSDLKHQVGC